MNRVQRLSIFISLIFGFFISYGQTKIVGLVKASDDGVILPGANVSIREKNNALILAYAIVDERGNYTLNFKSSADSLLIIVSAFNMKRQDFFCINKSQNINFDLVPQIIKLKEIKIKPPRIRKLGDTLNYLVDEFTNRNSRSIGDALKNMPGIDVGADGSISYHNKPINKFYRGQ